MINIKNSFNGEIKRGDIFWYANGESISPVLVIQNDFGNKHSPKTIVLKLNSSKAVEEKHLKIPTIVKIYKTELVNIDFNHSKKFDDVGYVLTSDFMTVSKDKLIDYIGSINSKSFNKINVALKISLDLE